MAVALVVSSVDITRRKKRITYNATLSGNYATNGDTLDFTAATDPSFKGARIPSVAPELIEVLGSPGGYDLEGVIGTLPTNCKLKAFGAGSGGATPVEVSAGAYPAGITGDTANVKITASFPIGKS